MIVRTILLLLGCEETSFKNIDYKLNNIIKYTLQ